MKTTKQQENDMTLDEIMAAVEVDGMRGRLRFVLDNLDSLEKRDEVKDTIESVYFRLDNLTKPTEGELRCQ
jgi:hypothetical protein